MHDVTDHEVLASYAIEHDLWTRWDPTPHGERPDGTPYPGCWVPCGPDDRDAIPDLNSAAFVMENARGIGVWTC